MKGNIVLCGFMGSGKTTVGRRLSKLLHRKFCDLDQYIEKREGMTIPEIFERFGESGFRARETEAAAEAAVSGDMVLACGGGTVLFPNNVEALHRNHGTIILLDASLPLLQDRLKNDFRRPLLQKMNRAETIAQLYEQRFPIYRAAADIIVDASGSADDVARRIIALDL